MAEFFDTNIQFLDDSAALVNGGRVFFGKPNTDPTVLINQIDIFNDRELTIALPNPIDIGSDGRTVSKVWIGERYSFEIQDINNVNIFESADQGESPSTGATITLSNVIGTNAITAEASPSISEYVDKQQYILTIAGQNTGNVTLDIDGQDPKSILFNFKEEIAPAFFQENQIVIVAYNSVEDAFFWVDSGRGISLLTNVAGDGDTITADGGPSTVANVDQQQYSLIPNANNSGAATLQLGALPARSIKSKGAELPKDALMTGIPALVAYNSIVNIYELLNFTSGLRAFTTFINSGTWTRNPATTSALIICVGSGGGGGGSPSVNSIGGGGGGAGALSITFATTFIGATDTVTIGAGGGGGAGGGSPTSGGIGGDVSVGTLCVAKGGLGGTPVAEGGSGGASGPGTGTLKIDGGFGGSTDNVTAKAVQGGHGGASFMGGGGKGGAGQNGAGSAALVLGSGGGGGSVTGGNGGAGKTGVVIIIEFG